MFGKNAHKDCGTVMKEKLYEIRSEFHTFYTDRCGNGGTGLSVYYPKEKTPRSQIAVIAMHPGGYMGFSPMIERERGCELICPRPAAGTARRPTTGAAVPAG